MRLSIAIFLATALAGALPAAVASEQHAHAPAPVAPAQEAQVQRFATDAVLRREMQGIHTAVEALGHYEHGHMGPEQAVILANAVEGHVRTIIANCKLPPDADAALHTIIGPLMQGAAALKQKPQDLSPIDDMRSALGQYDRQFQDP